MNFQKNSPRNEKTLTKKFDRRLPGLRAVKNRVLLKSSLLLGWMDTKNPRLPHEKMLIAIIPTLIDAESRPFAAKNLGVQILADNFAGESPEIDSVTGAGLLSKGIYRITETDALHLFFRYSSFSKNQPEKNYCPFGERNCRKDCLFLLLLFFWASKRKVRTRKMGNYL